MSKYKATVADLERNKTNFRYQTLHSDEQKERYGQVRQWHQNLADFLLMVCPSSRELSLALTKLEESMFWATASIARNEKPTEAATP